MDETKSLKNSDKVVIIGASHAGIAFADSIRKSGFSGGITLVDSQKGGPMERPPLSKKFLLETEDKVNPMFLLKRGKWYKENEINLKHGVTVRSINREDLSLDLDDDSSLSYDKLILATGAKPNNIKSAEGLKNSFVLRQPDDAVLIRNAARSAKSAIIIGGGYIGLEVAASLIEMGLSVTVIEAAPRLLARVASPPIADLVSKLHSEKGVSLKIGDSVQDIISADGLFSRVTLDSGFECEADMLVVGIGVRPNSELAKNAGLETEHEQGGAIMVDSSFQTSDSNIFALGDVALIRESDMRIESVHNAQYSATKLAAILCGGSQPGYEAPWFWSDQYDLNLQSVGIVPTHVDEAYQVSRPSDKEKSMSIWTFIESSLIAVETVRDAKAFMMAKKCLDSGISPDPAKIHDPEYTPF